jgi:alkanesulfonate monooxygenase SsuD/methylene tetrahydromethanopterin reductase-like flavin-dependent oxidoreductase (luciferase family)
MVMDHPWPDRRRSAPSYGGLQHGCGHDSPASWCGQPSPRDTAGSSTREAVIPTLQRRIDRAPVPDPYIPGYPYIGSPVSIARQLQEVIMDSDFDGIVLTFPDLIADLQFFGQRVLPMMADAGFARSLHPVSIK